MLADIAITNRAEQRIGQRMEQDIRIGIAQPACDDAEWQRRRADMIACREGMDIIAEAGPDFRDRRQMALGAGEISSRVILNKAALRRRRSRPCAPERPPDRHHR